MATMTDYHEFCDETGRIIDWFELERLGIESELIGSCAYGRHELPLLIAFCQENPSYHILSQLGHDLILNHVDHRAKLYLIGEGNSDPALCFVGKPGHNCISYKDALKAARE